MNNQKGQTTVEYILLLAVIMAIMSSVFNQLQFYLVEGPNSLQNQFLGTFQNNLQGFNGRFEGQYKFFRIRK